MPSFTPRRCHTARALGACVDVVSIQHDYDIWGGDDGEYVFDFLRALEVPVVATLHTILAKPTTRQRTILSDLIASVDATVVMSKAAATLLTTGYGVVEEVNHRLVFIASGSISTRQIRRGSGVSPYAFKASW